MTIPKGKTLTVPSGKTITIEKNGKLEIEKGAQLYVDGTVQGNITGAGKIYYKLNYDLDGGEWKNGYKPEDYYQFGTAFDLPTEENLNKAGYTLSGWTEKGKKDVVWKIPATATGIKSVVAQWEKVVPTATPVPDASGLPKTGDASAPMAWCALGLACLAGLAAMKRRK